VKGSFEKILPSLKCYVILLVIEYRKKSRNKNEKIDNESIALCGIQLTSAKSGSHG
jgi:hypothetical protein